MEISNLPLKLIDIPAGHRKSDAAKVADLAKSISKLDLAQSICVSQNGERYTLVFGAHRVKALRQLGRETVPATICQPDQARMLTIAENLHRAELTAAERAVQTAEFQTLGGGSTVKAMAQASGRSTRTVARDAAVGKTLDPVAAKLIHGLPIEENRTELAKLAAHPVVEQQAIAESLRRGKVQRVPEATTRAQPSVKPPAKPVADSFKPVYEALGQLKKQMDGLRATYPHGLYDVAMKRLDNVGDMLKQWKEQVR